MATASIDRIRFCMISFFRLGLKKIDLVTSRSRKRSIVSPSEPRCQRRVSQHGMSHEGGEAAGDLIPWLSGPLKFRTEWFGITRAKDFHQLKCLDNAGDCSQETQRGAVAAVTAMIIRYRWAEVVRLRWLHITSSTNSMDSSACSTPSPSIWDRLRLGFGKGHRFPLLFSLNRCSRW